MIEYYITKQSDGSHTVAKFDNSGDAVAVYTVKGKSCDCMSGSKRGHCKHTQMVAEWKPGYYYEGAGTVILLPLSHGLISDKELSDE